MEHRNRVKQKISAGNVATIVGGHSLTSATIDFLGPLDFDGYWLEGEHGAVAWDEIGDMSRACDLWGKTSVMRVQANEFGRITRTLDNGASGIVVPHVNTRSQAQSVVEAARFAPVGQRGFYDGRRSYGVSDFYGSANDDTLVVVLIEEVQAIENLSEILKVDGIDVFFVAPGDLSQSMGFVGQMHHPEVQSVVDSALRQIVSEGHNAGTLGFEDTLEHYIGMGVRMFLVTYDRWLLDGAERCIKQVKSLDASSTVK